MTYIKLFIDVAKKNDSKAKPDYYPGLEKRIREIFKEPLEDLFDKPELILNNFEIFLSYSQDYYNNLIKEGIKPGPKQLDEVIYLVVQDDKKDENEYYKKLFLLEFLGCKIDKDKTE
jgi:hypothetical protein